MLGVRRLAFHAIADSVALEANAAVPTAAPAQECVALTRCTIVRAELALATYACDVYMRIEMTSQIVTRP